MKLFSVLVYLSFLHCTLLGQTHKTKKFPIIDMHLHSDWYGRPFLKEPLTGLTSYKDEQTYRDSTFWYLKHYHVVRAVTDGVSALSYSNQNSALIITAIGDNNPDSLETWLKNGTLEKWLKEGRYKVLAEFAPQYNGMGPTDENLESYFSLAERYNIPFGIHMGPGPPGAAYIGIPKFRMSLGNPLLLEDILVKHPKLRLYVMHAGWPFLNEMIAALYAYPQLYIDIAVINWVLPVKEFHGYIKRIVESGFGKRIMFGSDEMQWPQSYNISVANILSSNFLTQEQKEDIFYNNAARFLKLSEEEIKKDKGQ